VNKVLKKIMEFDSSKFKILFEITNIQNKVLTSPKIHK